MKKFIAVTATILAFAGNFAYAQNAEEKPKSLEKPTGGVLGQINSELTGNTNTTTTENSVNAAAPANNAQQQNQLSKLENTLYLDLKDGRVVIELLPDLAPNHVARFKELVRQGFYNNTVFHRVIEGFMAQGGDPTGTGRGGSGQNIKAEFSGEKHVRGTLSMARAMDPDSADSQFFICFDEAPHLDGQYTIFGRVTKGMEFVDKIKKGDGPNGRVSEPDSIVKLQVAADAPEAPQPIIKPVEPEQTQPSTEQKPTMAPLDETKPVAEAEPITPESEANKATIQEAIDRNNERTADDLVVTEPLVDKKTVTSNVAATTTKPVPSNTAKAPAKPATKTKEEQNTSTVKTPITKDTTAVETPEVKEVETPATPKKPAATRTRSNNID
jgi:peptidylprolyl isomerase